MQYLLHFSKSVHNVCPTPIRMDVTMALAASQMFTSDANSHTSLYTHYTVVPILYAQIYRNV